MSDPATADHAAQQRSEFDLRFPPNRLATRSQVGMGPESAPPARVTHPLAPNFKGSRWDCERLSMRSPSKLSKIAAPSPRACKARLLRCPINSRIPTAAPTPEAAKCRGRDGALRFHTGIALATISTP